MYHLDYSDIVTGVTVELRDGRMVEVDCASSQNKYDYATFEEREDGAIFLHSWLPVETILVGHEVTGQSVVTDMSEVVRIVE